MIYIGSLSDLMNKVVTRSRVAGTGQSVLRLVSVTGDERYMYSCLTLYDAAVWWGKFQWLKQLGS